MYVFVFDISHKICVKLSVMSKMKHPNDLSNILALFMNGHGDPKSTHLNCGIIYVHIPNISTDFSKKKMNYFSLGQT